MKHIVIAGASGFVGQNLKTFFSKLDYKVSAISRDILNDKNKLQELLSSSDVVINLSGANIINRWSESYKKLLYSSRIDTSSKIVSALNSIEDVNKKPKVLISTSAVGIYDNKAIYAEDGNYSNDFLSNLCQDWEKEALKASSTNTKVVIFRFGIVLGEGGGALSKMLLPFKMGLGGVIGSGNQAFSYIHIEDLLNAYKFVIEKELDGVFNLCAPEPTTNKGLTKALGKALNRPTFFPVPEFILEMIFSEGAKVLTDGQSAIPKKLLDNGFIFKYKNIEETINNICK